MKKLTYILMGFFLIFASACEEIETPFPQFKDLQYGAYARLLGSVGGEFNYFNVGGSAISFEVEFYDENKGKNVASYSWTVSFIDRANNGANNKAAVPLVTVPASAFVVNANGLPGTKLTFTFQQVLTALGLTIDKINGGDTFEFQGTVTKTDGTTYGFSNTDANLINQPAFKAMVFLRQNVICPSTLAGEYIATTTGTSTDPCCPTETTLENQTVKLVSKGSGKYEISDWSAGLYLKWYEVYGITPETNLKAEITDACGKISGSFAEPFGTTTTVTGTSNPSTGTITYTWKNGYDDVATVTLKKK
ncbi:MAG: hypothetical protein SFU99_11980 [Saprospiraceae bacterium]|nr:hypothetical protein [Saprospiraceae bacterium]